MKLTIFTHFTFLAIWAFGLALPEQMAAQQTRYKLIDLGTLGGPHSYGSFNGDGFQLLNNSGVVTSSAELATPDPNAAYGCGNPECLQVHAFRWRTA